MRKTLLAVAIATSSLLALPAFAQLHLGGATQVGGGIGVNAGGLTQGTMQTTQNTLQTTNALQRASERHARKVTHQTTKTAKQAASTSARASANPQANVSASTPAAHASANASANAGANVSGAAVTGAAGDTARHVTGAVRNKSEAALKATQRATGKVGHAADSTNANGSINGSANVRSRSQANQRDEHHAMPKRSDRNDRAASQANRPV